MAEAPAKTRKRKAVAELRELAAEVGLEQDRRSSDLKEAEFARVRVNSQAGNVFVRRGNRFPGGSRCEFTGREPPPRLGF